MSENTVKITAFECENFKRVRAVSLLPKDSGLTIIGGDNRQGKTSLLEGIAACLGGQRLDPSSAVHDGAKKAKNLLKLSNGITVEKSFTGRNSYLKVYGVGVEKGGQQLLDSFISEFALDIGTFIRSRPKQQAQILLQSLGIDLSPFDLKEKELCEEREKIGQQKRAAEGHEAEIAYDEEAGMEIKEPTELMRELEDVVNHNAKLRDASNKVESLKLDVSRAQSMFDAAVMEVSRIEAMLEAAKQKVADGRNHLSICESSLKAASAAALMGVPKDDSEIRKRMADLEAFNNRVRMNQEKKRAALKASSLAADYAAINGKIDAVRRQRLDKLDAAGLPLPELSVENDVLLYKGKEFDCMSGAEQMIVATAICRKIKPKMGFVLVDKLEAMDMKSLREFGAWAETEGLQVIGTRVSQGEECSIIIEDGMIVGDEAEPAAVVPVEVFADTQAKETIGVRKQFQF